MKRFRVEIMETNDAHYIVTAADRTDAETIAVADHEGPRLFRVWWDVAEREVLVDPPRKRAGDVAPAERWMPPDEDRVPMNVHAEAREALRWLLTHDLSGSGVGYSEFIRQAVVAYERGEWSLPGVPNQLHSRSVAP